MSTLLRRGARPVMGGALAAVYFLVNVPGVYAVESSFWSDRRERVGRRRAPENQTLLAQLPSGVRGSLGDSVLPPVAGRLSEESLGGAARLPVKTPTTPALERAFGWLPAVVAPFGDVRDVYLSPRSGAPTIIHLQDAHEIAEAQRNLAGLTTALKASHGLSLVGLEGAVGAFALDPYRRYPNPDVTRALADTFLGLGYLTGPEAAAVTGDKPPLLWGVEDPGLYRDNIAAFENSERTRARVQALAAKLSAAADEARNRFYSPALRALDDHRRAYHDQKEGLAAYAAYLWGLRRGATTEFENTRLLREALQWEERLDFVQVENERRALVEALSRRLPEEALSGLVRESLDYRAGRLSYGDYHRYLRRLCADHGLGLERYPQLSAYVSYVLLAERIDRDGLLQELDALERSAETTLAVSPEEKALVSVRRGLTLLDKLATHGLTPAEWQAYAAEKPRLLALPQTLSTLVAGPIAGTDALNPQTLDSFERFCSRALDRNGALIKNLLEKMHAEGTSTAVLVAGGFHTAGLAQLCRQQGISYAIVSPRLTKVPAVSRPLDVFARQPLPLEKMLAGEIIHLAYPRLGQAAGPGLDAQGSAAARQQTAQILWASLQEYLLSLASHFAPEDRTRYAEFARQFSTLRGLSADVLNVGGGVRALAVRATAADGQTKEMAILSAPDGGTDAFARIAAAPAFEGRLEMPGGPMTLRVYALSDVATPGFLGRIVWLGQRTRGLAAGNVRPWVDRFSVRLRRMFAPKTAVAESELSLDEAHGRAIAEVSARLGLRVAELEPIARHMRRVRELADRVAKSLEMSEDDIALLRLAASAHDIGKFHEDCVEHVLTPDILPKDSPAFRALAEHERLVFDVLGRQKLSLSEDVALILRAHSALGAGARESLKDISGLTERHVRLALVLALADVADGYRDMHRPYIQALVRQNGFPTIGQLEHEFMKYTGRLDGGPFAGALTDPAAFFARVSAEPWFAVATERTLIEHVAGLVQTGAAGLSGADKVRLLAREIGSHRLTELDTPADQWWPALVDALFLRGAAGDGRGAVLKSLLADLRTETAAGRLDARWRLAELTAALLSPAKPGPAAPREILLAREWTSENVLAKDIDATARAVRELAAQFPSVAPAALSSLTSYALGETEGHGAWDGSPARLELSRRGDTLRLRIENDGGYPLPNQPPKNIRNRSFTPATAEPLIYSSRGVESGSGAGTAYIAVYFNQIYQREVPKELTSRARLAWTQRTLGPNRYRIALTVNIPLHSAIAARGGAIPAVTAYWEPKFVSLLGERWGRYLYRAVAGPTLEDLFGGLGNSESINSALLLPMVVGAVMNLSGDPVLGAFVPAFILLFNRLLFVVRHPEGQRTEAGFIAVLGGAGAFAVAWMGAFSPVAAALGFLAGWSFHVATNAVSNFPVLFQGKPKEPSPPSTPARTKIGLVLLLMGTLFLSPMYRGGGSALIGAVADRWAGWTIAAAGLLVLVASGNPLMNAKRGLDRLLTSAFARGISNRWTNLVRWFGRNKTPLLAAGAAVALGSLFGPSNPELMFAAAATTGIPLVRRSERRDLNIASVSVELAPPHGEVNQQIRGLMAFGHAILRRDATGAWSVDNKRGVLALSDRDAAALSKDPVLNDFEIHFVGDGAFRYLHVWPWGAQEGHGGGLSTVGTKKPVKRVFIARGLWESNRERALTVLRHEATEVNLWWEQATKLEDEKQIVNTDRKAEALAAVAALRGRPRKKSDVMVAADAKLPTIREWIRENALGAVVALTSRFHNMANRRYRTEHPLDFIPLPNTLNGAVAMVSWEHRDFFKRGGLGDAISEASYNLAKLGQDVDLYMPMHKEMEGKAAWEDTGFTVPVVSAGDRVLFRVYRTEIEVPTPGAGRLTVYALKDVTERTAENERWRLFQYGYNAPNDLRYFEYPLKESALGAKAVVEAMKLVHGDRRGRVRYRAVNAHDWQAALVPVFMKADTAFAGVGRILTVHNGAYMGNFRLKNDDGSDSYNQEFLRGLGLPAGYDRFGPGDPLEFHGQVVLQKAALLAAHKINPVSPQYRNELLSPDDYVLPGNTRDMAGVYRSRQADLVGVMNGLDHDIWNPERDPADPAAPYAYTSFVAKDVREKKPANKANFQKALGLTVDPDAPMMYACARLSEQKGFDFVADALEDLLTEFPNAQFVIMGDSDNSDMGNDLARRFADFRTRYPGRVWFGPFAGRGGWEHYMGAAADFVLSPSRFEPAGLAEKKGMRLGAVPIVRAVGGLQDTVIDPRDDPDNANGFKFTEPTGAAFGEAARRALRAYQAGHGQRTGDEPNIDLLQQNAMRTPKSWEDVAREYLGLYSAARDAAHTESTAEIAARRHALHPTAPLIGHLPAGVDLGAIRLERGDEVRGALADLEEWMATVISGPPPTLAGSRRGEAIPKTLDLLRQELGALSSDADAGLFDADGLQRDEAARVLGFGFAETKTATGRARLGLSDEFFKPDSVLYPHRREALFHEAYHVILGLADNSTIHRDALRLQAALFWGVPAEEAFGLSLEQLEAHPKNGLGRALRVRRLLREFRGEDANALADLLAEKLENGQLIPFLTEADDALHVPLALSPGALERRTWERVDLMRRLEGEPPRGRGDTDPRYAEARRAEEDWSKPLIESGPVEALQPVLKALTLLSTEQEERLMGELSAAVARDAALADRPIVDGLFLMTGRIPPEWAKLHGIAYQRVYHSSAEGRKVWAGGLGPVQVFHSDAERQITRDSAMDIVDIEPDYTHRRTAEGMVPAERVRPSTPLKPSHEPPFDLDVMFHGHPVKIRVRPMRGPEGNPVYLFRDNPDGDAHFTKQLYDYRPSGDNPASWEEFTAFFGVATLAIIGRLEENRQKTLGAQWRPPVVHGNDAQTAMAIVLLAEIAKGGNPRAAELVKSVPFLGKLAPLAARSFKTHTYGNRQGYTWGRPEDHYGVASYLSGIPEWDHDRLNFYFARRGPEGHGYPDVTAAAIAATPGHAQGVARKHGWDVMRKYDDPQKVVGITNGANLKWSAGLFWDYLQEVGHENADRLRPTAEQARDAKRLAKERFFTDLLVHPQHVEEQFYRRFRYILNDPAKRGEPTPALDPTLLAQPTVGFVGRLVNEKFNMGRGWTTRNIEELVKAGYNVVLFAPIQQKSDPTSPSAAMARTLEALSGNLDREWRPGHGRLIYIDSRDSELKKSALASLDILVLDSDKDTEANGYTEVAASASGALVLAPPFHNGEGLIRGQGVPIDFARPGHGNTLIPRNQKPESYVEVLREARDVYAERPLDFAAHQATSVRLSRVLEARLTAAASLRDFNLSYGLPLGVSTDPAWFAGVTVGENQPVTLEARVRVRPGVDASHLDVRARLGEVPAGPAWGGQWSGARDILLEPVGPAETASDGSAVLRFSKSVDLPRGAYEFVVESRDRREPDYWVLQDGIHWGQNNRLVVGPSPRSGAPAGLLPVWRPVLQNLRFAGWSDRTIARVLGVAEELFLMGAVTLVGRLLEMTFGLPAGVSLLLSAGTAVALFPLGHIGGVHLFEPGGRLRLTETTAQDLTKLTILGAGLRVAHLGLVLGLPWMFTALAGAPVLGPPGALIELAAQLLPFLAVPLLHGRYNANPPRGWPLGILSFKHALLAIRWGTTVSAGFFERFVPRPGVPVGDGYISNPRRTALIDRVVGALVATADTRLNNLHPLALRGILDIVLKNVEQHGVPGAEAQAAGRIDGDDLLLEVRNTSDVPLAPELNGAFSLDNINGRVAAENRSPGTGYGIGVTRIPDLARGLYLPEFESFAGRARWSWSTDRDTRDVVFQLRVPLPPAPAAAKPHRFVSEWEMPGEASPASPAPGVWSAIGRRFVAVTAAVALFASGLALDSSRAWARPAPSIPGATASDGRNDRLPAVLATGAMVVPLVAASRRRRSDFWNQVGDGKHPGWRLVHVPGDNGETIEAAVKDAGRGPVVVWNYGGGSGPVLERQADWFADRPAVVVRRREAPADALVGQTAGDTIRALQTLRFQGGLDWTARGALIVGHSLGAHVATNVALRLHSLSRGAVRAVVLLNPPVPNGLWYSTLIGWLSFLKGASETLDSWLEAARFSSASRRSLRQQESQWWGHFIETWIPSMDDARSDIEAPPAIPWALFNGWDHMLSESRALGHYLETTLTDRLEELSKLPAPVLVVASPHDPLAGEIHKLQKALALEAIPDANLPAALSASPRARVFVEINNGGADVLVEHSPHMSALAPRLNGLLETVARAAEIPRGGAIGRRVALHSVRRRDDGTLLFSLQRPNGTRGSLPDVLAEPTRYSVQGSLRRLRQTVQLRGFRPTVDPLGGFANLLNGRRLPAPAVYRFDEAPFDLRGLAYAGSLVHEPAVALHRDLLQHSQGVRDVAIFHEFLEYLSARNYLTYQLDETRKSLRVEINVPVRWHTFKSAWDISLTPEALELARRGAGQVHYFHRAVTRATLEDLDRELTETIRESVRQRLAPVDQSPAARARRDLEIVYRRFRQNTRNERFYELMAEWLHQTGVGRSDAALAMARMEFRTDRPGVEIDRIGTLADPDLLERRPFGTGALRAGDVVVAPFIPTQMVRQYREFSGDRSWSPDDARPAAWLEEFLGALPAGVVLVSIDAPLKTVFQNLRGTDIETALRNQGLWNRTFAHVLQDTGWYEDRLTRALPEGAAGTDFSTTGVDRVVLANGASLSLHVKRFERLPPGPRGRPGVVVSLSSRTGADGTLASIHTRRKTENVLRGWGFRPSDRMVRLVAALGVAWWYEFPRTLNVARLADFVFEHPGPRWIRVAGLAAIYATMGWAFLETLQVLAGQANLVRFGAGLAAALLANPLGHLVWNLVFVWTGWELTHGSAIPAVPIRAAGRSRSGWRVKTDLSALEFRNRHTAPDSWTPISLKAEDNGNSALSFLRRSYELFPRSARREGPEAPSTSEVAYGRVVKALESLGPLAPRLLSYDPGVRFETPGHPELFGLRAFSHWMRKGDGDLVGAPEGLSFVVLPAELFSDPALAPADRRELLGTAVLIEAVKILRLAGRLTLTLERDERGPWLALSVTNAQGEVETSRFMVYGEVARILSHHQDFHHLARALAAYWIPTSEKRLNDFLIARGLRGYVEVVPPAASAAARPRAPWGRAAAAAAVGLALSFGLPGTDFMSTAAAATLSPASPLHWIDPSFVAAALTLILLSAASTWEPLRAILGRWPDRLAAAKDTILMMATSRGPPGGRNGGTPGPRVPPREKAEILFRIDGQIAVARNAGDFETLRKVSNWLKALSLRDDPDLVAAAQRLSAAHDSRREYHWRRMIGNEEPASTVIGELTAILLWRAGGWSPTNPAPSAIESQAVALAAEIYQRDPRNGRELDQWLGAALPTLQRGSLRAPPGSEAPAQGAPAALPLPDDVARSIESLERGIWPARVIGSRVKEKESPRDLAVVLRALAESGKPRTVRFFLNGLGEVYSAYERALKPSAYPGDSESRAPAPFVGTFAEFLAAVSRDGLWRGTAGEIVRADMVYNEGLHGESPRYTLMREAVNDHFARQYAREIDEEAATGGRDHRLYPSGKVKILRGGDPLVMRFDIEKMPDLRIHGLGLEVNALNRDENFTVSLNNLTLDSKREVLRTLGVTDLRVPEFDWMDGDWPKALGTETAPPAAPRTPRGDQAGVSSPLFLAGLTVGGLVALLLVPWWGALPSLLVGVFTAGFAAFVLENLLILPGVRHEPSRAAFGTLRRALATTQTIPDDEKALAELKKAFGTFKAAMKTSAEEMPDAAAYRAFMWAFSDGLDAVVREVFRRTAAHHPLLNRTALMAHGSYGSRRPGLISDVDLHLLLPDDLPSPAPDNPLGKAYEALYYGLEKVLGAQDPKPLKDFQHAGDVEHAMAFWEPKSNQMGSSYTGVDALRVYGLTARPVAGNADLFEEGVRPAYRQLLSRYRREILRGVILEREAQFESADSSLLRPDFKAGLGGVREYDTITWMSRFLFPRGAEGLVGLLTGWTVLAAQRRVSLPQLLRARQAFLRQARLRDRRVDFDQLSREEKIQYVQDAGLLFDTLVSLLQSYWLEVRRPQDPEYLPFFLASAGWRPRSAANVQRQLDDDLSRREGRLVAVRARRSGAEGMAEFAIEALRDRPGVLAVLSGLMAAHGFSIRAAEAQFERGRIFDRFYVHLGPLAAADKKVQDGEIARLGRAVENAAADVLAGDRIEMGRVAADFADAGRAYLFVLPRRHPVAATLAFFTGRAGARALAVLTSDRVLGGDEDQKEFLGTLHVITRWLAERGYNIVGDPSIRTQRGIVLDTFGLSHLDGSPLSAAEEESVAFELQKFLDRPEIGENDFGNGSLPRTPSGPMGSPGWLAGLTLRDIYHSLGLFFPPFHHMAEAVSPGVVGFPILPGNDKGVGASATPEAAATSKEPPHRPAEMTYDMTPEKRDHLAATVDYMRALVAGRRPPAVKRLRKYTDDDYTFSHVYELLMSVSMNGTVEDRRTAIQLLDILTLPRKTYSSLDYDLICFYLATRAELLVQEGKIADALKSMKAHAELFDKYNASSDMVPATRLDMARFGAVKWARLASPLYDLQDFDNCRLAIETAGRYLNQAGVDEEARLTDPFNWVMSTRHLLEGMMLIRRGDAVTASGKRSAQERRRLLEAALVHYQRSESFLPEEPFGLIQRAGALYRLDRNGEARRVLSRALELGSDFGVAHALRGQFLLDAASRAAARRPGRARDLLVQALAAFKTAAAAPQQADVSPLRLRLIEMETYLRLARLAASDADRQEWEGQAQGQLATGITAYFQKAVNDGTLIEPFLHEWIVYGEERGNPTPGLDLLLGQKDNQRGQEFMKAAAHAVRTSSRSLEKWTDALLAKALDPADRRGRAAAVRMIGYLGEQSVLRTLVRRALAAGDADLLPEAVEALGEGASALPVPLLLTLSGRSEIQRKPRARRVVDDALGLQRAAFESDLIDLTNEDVTAPASVNARERQDQRRWAASLLGRLDDKRQEAVELKINLGRVINGESGESRLNRFAAGLAAFVARLDAAEEAVVHQKVYNALVPFQGTINTIVFRRDGDRLNALEKRFDALVADFAAQSPNPMDVESVRALVDGVRSDLARAREFLNYPLETWQIRVHALLDRYNNTTEENFPEPVLWDQELAAIQSVAAELRADLEKSPFPDMMERHAEMEVEALGLIEDHLAEERREYRETLGGRWPLLETIYRRIGGLGGLVLLPVTLESVVPALLSLSVGAAVGISGGVPLWGFAAYQMAWHLAHIPGAPGRGADRLLSAFSQEKMAITLGVFFGILGAQALGLADAGGLSFWASLAALALPHAAVNAGLWFATRRALRPAVEIPIAKGVNVRPETDTQRLLNGLLFGGPAESRIAYSRFVVSRTEAVRRALVERAAARAQRERLAAILGLAPGSSMGDIAFRLGRVHRGGGDLASIVRGRGWPGARLDARQAHDVAALISLAGGWSLIPNLPKKALKVMREYHRGEGLVDFHERIVQSLTDRGAGETPRVVLFEITTNLLDGKTKLEGRDEAIRRALEFWARRPNTVVNRVVWVLPQGRSAVDLIALFRRSPALAPLVDGGLKGIPIVSPPTQKGRLKSITALLLRAQNLSNPGELRPADLYLLNRSEWDLSDLPGHLKGLVNFLILLAGDVVFDATDRLADDVKRLNVVSTNA